MIKAIIFDCFGVLTTDKWKEFVASLPKEQILPATDLNHALDKGFISQAEFFEQINLLTGRTPERVESVINPDAIKNVQLLEYIMQLKKKYKIGMLSNISSNWVRESFLSKTEQQLFDDMVLSFEVGLIKPEIAIYELAASRLNTQPSDCLFIDDSSGHCHAAIQSGMRAIIYNDFMQFRKDIQTVL
ncbi:MAG: glucose-phosphatase [Patescibacteria group bacterium]|jgi:HAD superfamily hydrolase (TIGR01509 family)|nr:glucose-phosphatase [Patescibacteria group bacterium]